MVFSGVRLEGAAQSFDVQEPNILSRIVRLGRSLMGRAMLEVDRDPPAAGTGGDELERYLTRLRHQLEASSQDGPKIQFIRAWLAVRLRCLKRPRLQRVAATHGCPKATAKPKLAKKVRLWPAIPVEKGRRVIAPRATA